jgi:extradiol dioxygenase family protein
MTAVMIGVEALARSRKFYGEGMGCTIDQDSPNFVSFKRSGRLPLEGGHPRVI